jgi:hypothetical protein
VASVSRRCPKGRGQEKGGQKAHMSTLINKGGINGIGEGVVNINAKDYKGLKKAIKEHYKLLNENQTSHKNIT